MASMPYTPPGSASRAFSIGRAPHGRRRASLFDETDDWAGSISATPVAQSFQYLLTLPDKVPALSRSSSLDSIESHSESRASSCSHRSARIATPIREPVDLTIEDPLFSAEDELFAPQSVSSAQSDSSSKSTLSFLLKPLTSVGPTLRSSSFVSSLSSGLSAWAASISAAQFDQANLMLPSNRQHYQISTAAHRLARPDAVNAPKPVKQSGSQATAALSELEMERALTGPAPHNPSEMGQDAAAERLMLIELQPWPRQANAAEPPSIETGKRRRPREPRLNPDFLRILVLEQNMIRKGKLRGTTDYARMILAAREDDVRDDLIRRGSLRQVMVIE
jgi:hypothetical protein